MNSASPWTDFLSGINGGDRVAVAFVAIGCALALILGLAGLITKTIRSVSIHRAEIELKRDMLSRGMSADEIAKIIESTSPAGGPQRG